MFYRQLILSNSLIILFKSFISLLIILPASLTSYWERNVKISGYDLDQSFCLCIKFKALLVGACILELIIKRLALWNVFPSLHIFGPNHFLELQTSTSNCPLSSSTWCCPGHYVSEQLTLPLDFSQSTAIPPVTQTINLEILHDFSLSPQFTGLIPKCWPSYILPGGPRREWVCLFQFLHAACILWLVILLSIFKASRLPSLNISPTLIFLASPSYRDSYKYSGPIQIVQGHLPTSRPLT